MSYSTIDEEAQPIVSEGPTYSKKVLAGAVAIAFVMGAAAATSVPTVSTSTYLQKGPSVHVFTHNAELRAAVDVWTSNEDLAKKMFGRISTWDVSRITDMSGLFQIKTTFNDDISTWDVSRVTTMAMMFSCTFVRPPFGTCAFNQPLNAWDVSRVTDMKSMFSRATFNQPLNAWDVSRVKDMSYMFYEATDFNQPLNAWDVSKVKYMINMFSCPSETCVFNQPLNDWDVSGVDPWDGIKWTFADATAFNQDLDWCLSSKADTRRAFSRSGCESTSCGVKLEPCK